MSPRRAFGQSVTALLDERADLALVWAEIGGQFFREAVARHPERVVNVGIREQLLVSAAAGMALTGMRPMAHTFSAFLVERAFEQIKLDFGHQGVGGVLVGTGGSFDAAVAGRTHQSPGDVALMDTLDVTIHAPSTDAEVEAVLRVAAAADGLHYVRLADSLVNSQSFPPGGFHLVRRGVGPVLVVFGHLLDAALAAAEDTDATVLYATQVVPFDADGLRAALPDSGSGTGSGSRSGGGSGGGSGSVDVVLVEPWAAGTSARHIAEALIDRPHRLLCLGVGRAEIHRYGTPAEHVAHHGLDASGIRAAIERFARAAGSAALGSPAA